jgi:cold shock CspA family protein
MARGRVKWLNAAEGYGLIERLDGPGIGETCRCSLEGSPPLRIGQHVDFRATMDTKGRSLAVAVQLPQKASA